MAYLHKIIVDHNKQIILCILTSIKLARKASRLRNRLQNDYLC